MAIERTFSMIKPDAVQSGNIGNIIAMIESNGFKIIHARLFKFTDKSAGQFYEVHKDSKYYERLLKYIISDKVMAFVLEKENAIADLRKLVGPTDPKEADKKTIRGKFGGILPNNSIHASDTQLTAIKEITYIFGEFASIPSIDKENGKDY